MVGPELRLHQCGLPKAMAVELFKPFIIHKLVEKGIAETVKRAKKIVERESPEVYEILEEIIQDHPVLLNRAPTLHRLGIQAFEPVLVEGKAIRIHPLVCAAFNADFDGDQMAVHVPLSFEAQLEARLLMISSNNVLKPSDGRPVAEPSQDMVLGSYFLTKLPPGFEEELRKAGAGKTEDTRARLWKDAKYFGSLAEIEMALLNGSVGYHTAIQFWYIPPAETADEEARRPRWLRTTVGRVLFNSILPRRVVAELGFRDDLMKKKNLSELVLQSYRRAGLADTVTFLDRLKDFGFRFATMGGVSIGVEDLEIPAEKAELLSEADARVKRFQRAYNTGQITFGERYNKVIDAWTHANNDVAEAMINSMRVSRGGFNPVFMMFDSGSRGSRDQIRQLAGMRGLMAKPQKKLTGGIGEIIESPIKSNFREGLTVLEYFISTHGARKGLADTALKTADAGYLTRRLVDVAQDVTVTEEDCGTILGLEVTSLKEGEDIIEPLRERILGSVASEDVFDPHELDEDGDPRLLVEAGKLIDEDVANHDRRLRDREGQDPVGADLRGPAGHLPDVLRPQPGHHGHGGHGRGGGDPGRAVHRRAGHPAHPPDLPHRRHVQPHRGRGGAPGPVGRQGEVHRRPGMGRRERRVRGRHQGHQPGGADPRGRVGLGREQGRDPGGRSQGSEAGAESLSGARGCPSGGQGRRPGHQGRQRAPGDDPVHLGPVQRPEHHQGRRAASLEGPGARRHAPRGAGRGDRPPVAGRDGRSGPRAAPERAGVHRQPEGPAGVHPGGRAAASSWARPPTR